MFATITDALIFILSSLTIIMILRILLRSRTVRRDGIHIFISYVVYIVCGITAAHFFAAHSVIKVLVNIVLSVSIAMYIYEVRFYMSLIAVLVAMLAEAAIDAVALVILKFRINDILAMNPEEEKTGRYICKKDRKNCNLDEDHPVTCTSCRWLKVQ